MRIAQSRLEIDGLEVMVHRKKMKYLRLVVLPPDGRVRVSAPKSTSNAHICEFVSSHRCWIQQQQEKIATSPALAPLNYCDDEQHLFWGESLTLRVFHGLTRTLEVDGSEWHLRIRTQDDLPLCKKLFADFYRAELRRAVPPLLQYYQQQMGLAVNEWRIRAMKTRWGSCNIRDKRIWLNLALAQYPRDCLAYVIVHELAHLREKYHNRRFWGIVEQHFPNWRHVRQRLNQH